MAVRTGEIAPNVGERVKRLREARGFSLRELARAAGVSAPMLSQVERGETSPTLAVASKIAAGLELTLSRLLRLDERSHVVVVRESERRRVRRDGHSFEELSPPAPGQPHAVSIHTLEPGAATGGPDDPPLHEPGSRETITVQSGRIVLVFDKDRYELYQGDTVTFDADLPHHLENTGRKAAVFIAVVSSGLRRA